MTEPPVADPGWETTNDTCGATYIVGPAPFEAHRAERDFAALPDGSRRIVELVFEAVSRFPIGVCELDPGHVDRGEPHTLTLVWFDPVAEPDCTDCADTGSNAGQFCHCDAGKRLAGNPPEASTIPTRPDPHAGRWITDEDDQP